MVTSDYSDSSKLLEQPDLSTSTNYNFWPQAVIRKIIGDTDELEAELSYPSPDS